MFAYNKNYEEVYDLRVSSLINDWKADNLEYRILDSPLHVIDLPSDLVSMQFVKEGITDLTLAQTLILSSPNSYTSLHMDSPKQGGGWMYLVEGQKDWYFMKPTAAALQSLIEPDAPHLIDISYELAYQRAGTVFHEANAIKGDFLYFPPGWLHRVRTHDRSVGIGGYLLIEPCLSDSEALC